jgi:hypothetical protein
VDVPPKRVPYFKPGKELKDLINHEVEVQPAAGIAAADAGPTSNENPPPATS